MRLAGRVVGGGGALGRRAGSGRGLGAGSVLVEARQGGKVVGKMVATGFEGRGREFFCV